MSGPNCCFLTCIQISQEARNVIWYFHLFKKIRDIKGPFHEKMNTIKYWNNMNTVCCDTQSQGIWQSRWSRTRYTSRILLLFFYGKTNIGNLISGSLPFLNPTWTSGSFQFMYCWSLAWKFWAFFASMWHKCNCVVVWTFFGINFLWDWSENWPFPVLWPLLSFPNLLAHWM